MFSSKELEVISRRGLLIVAGGVLLDACKPPQEEFKEKVRPKEQEGILWDGDVVATGNSFNLLIDNRRHILSSEEFERIRKNSKFDQYGGRIFPASAVDLSKYKITEPSRLPTIIDPFTGGIKYNLLFGGELLLFFSGFLDDSGVPYTEINPAKHTFLALRGKDGLEKNGWSFFNSFFFTWGEKGLEEYSAADTAVDPKKKIQHGIEFVEEIIRLLPFARINGIGYSWGCGPLLAAAMKHPGVFNNLFFISGPNRGLKPTIERRLKARALKELLRARGINEELTDFLFSRGENKVYQEELDEFGLSFTKRGRGLYTVSSTDDDIVPPESTQIAGAVNIVETMGGSVNPADGHGRPLGNKRIIGKAIEVIGKNLAAAA